MKKIEDVRAEISSVQWKSPRKLNEEIVCLAKASIFPRSIVFNLQFSSFPPRGKKDLQ